jgi:TrmH family RNA methyltransferase
VITSPHNDKLKLIRKLHQKKHRDELGLFIAEGTDVVEQAGDFDELFLLAAELDVEPELLASVSTLGSGVEVIGVYRQRWSEPGGDLSVYLHGVRDPGNVGTVMRSAHALCDGPVVLGPGCADPFSPKAVRASMGSVFARPPARASFGELRGTTVALERGAGSPLAEVAAEAPLVLCLGAEREGLPAEVSRAASLRAHIPLHAGGPDSLNVAMAATVALYEVGNRMAGHA